MVPDPYHALGLSHDASQDEIKKAYRKLAMQLHPDRLTRVKASAEEVDKATAKFAIITSAYALLSDDKRKRDYDHIYKYGGYDEPTDKQPTKNGPRSTSPERRKSQKGIGYTITDPVSFILSKGKVRSKTVAGIKIPSRFNMAHSAPDGFRVSFSSGQVKESPCGTVHYTSKTTEFAQGKKFSRVETTTLHNDGRKEVVIEGDDYIERRFSTTPKRKRRDSSEEEKDDLTHQSHGDERPWYLNAWHGLRDVCNNPCGAISVR